MDGKKTLKPLLLTVLLFTVLVILPASAAEITFIDAAYNSRDQLIITDSLGDPVQSLTDNQTATLAINSAYFIEYHPTGLFDFASEAQDYNLNFLNFFIEWLKIPGNLPGFMVFVILCLFVALVVNRH